MTSRHALLVTALTLGFLGALGAPGEGGRVSTRSVADVASGVWWAGQADGVPAGPTPPQVPAGGLWVSSTPAGTVAMSAVRFTVGASDRQPILTLPIAMLSTLPKTVLPVDVDIHILACATTAPWTPPAAGTFGALSAAPSFDCGKGQVLGSLSVDGTQVEFELGQFVTATNKVVDVVIVPGGIPAPIPTIPVALPVPVDVPSLLLSPTFDITFNPVTAAAVEVLTAAPVTEDDFGFDSPVDPAFLPSPIELALGNPAAPRAPRGIAAFPGQVARQLGVVNTSPQRAQRTIAAVAFALLCAWAWLLNRDPVPGAPAGRPFRTLYDGAPPVSAAPKRGFGSGAARTGRPPPLR